MISSNRKMADQILTITDESGIPLAGKKVHVNQKDHAFLFGCGAFDAIPVANEEKDNPFFKDRMEKWLKLYNFGTMSFYWGDFESVEGSPLTENRMNASRFLKDHGAVVKGHPLCWHTLCVDWLLKYDNKTIMDKQLERIYRDVSNFRGVIDMWDVINETVIMPVFDRYDNAITRICNAYGRENLIREVFAAAKAANPDAVLLINDFNLTDDYRDVIDQCLNLGVPISAIGLQTHQHQGYMGRERLAEIVKRFEVFGLPLHFTENTLVSGHIMPPHIVDLNDYQIPSWPTTPEGEARQAAEMKDMYEFLFDQPLVEALTGWDFTDGAWLGAPSGVLRTDNTPKPSYEMLMELIHKKWHTELDLTTDEKGQICFTGYRGRYEITVEGKKADFTIDKGALEIVCMKK